MSAETGRAQGQERTRLGLGTFLDTTARILENWRLVFGVPLACMLLAAVLVLTVHATYRSEATFIVESESSLPSQASGLAGLALQFGLPVGRGGESPKFFAELATSREVLLAVAAARYPVPRAPADSTATLMALYRLPPLGTPRGDNAALRRLGQDVSSSVELETGVVTLDVDAPDPRLAAAIADTLLGALNRFNLERRQLRSHELREFLESRLADANRDLMAAEDSLRDFRRQNRTFAQSPDLQIQDQRLQRAVELRQSLYLSLSSSYEQARMEEYRDTPTITVVDEPSPPYGKIRPRRTLVVLGAGALGLLIGIAISLLSSAVTTLDEDDRRAWNAARAAAQDVPFIRALPFGRRAGQRRSG